MGICDDIKNWQEMSPNDRYQNVRDWIKETARDWGFGDDVSVHREPPPGHPERRGGYDPDTNTIYLHPDTFKDGSDDGWKYAYDTAAHETAHHVQDEMDDAYDDGRDDSGSDPDDGYDGEDEGDDEEGAGDAGDTMEGDDGSREVIDMADADRHEEAQDFADSFLDAAEEACENDPDGAESIIKGFLGEWLMERGAADAEGPSETGDWVLPSGDTTYG